MDIGRVDIEHCVIMTELKAGIDLNSLTEWLDRLVY